MQTSPGFSPCFPHFFLNPLFVFVFSSNGWGQTMSKGALDQPQREGVEASTTKAEEDSDQTDQSQIQNREIKVPTVVIDDQRQSPIDSLSVFKSEKISREKFEDPHRQSLADLVKDQVGVDTQVYCSNCGAKRLTINGLKGEHTSILVDGLPLHSAVSSFYGVDNVPVQGLVDVRVMRGAGASLTNPEAIGGTLNLVTVNPLDIKDQYSTSISVDDRFGGKAQNHSLLYSFGGENKKWAVTLGGQLARTETWDEDQNQVSEMPQRQNSSVLLKTRFLIGEKNDFSIRLGRSELDILGGFWDPVRPSEVRKLAAGEDDFEEGRVDRRFIGSPEKITDWVHILRSEAATTGTHYLNHHFTWQWKLGYARQEQQAIYQHGFDYGHRDDLFVGDNQLRWVKGLHTLTAGIFFKDQKLRSNSQTLFEKYPSTDPRDIKKDNFNFSSYASYVQYSYLLAEKVEVDVAIRADQLKIRWLELVNEVDEFILAPRFQILHNLTHHLQQRFSYGLGYRAPLTFFESQHGNNESGYEVDIRSLEKAHSLVYSLSLNTPSYYMTGGLHYTQLKNMAYGFDSFSRPVLYRNADETYQIWVADLLAGYKPRDWWLLEATLEFFQYEDGYKERLPTAAIEQRFQLRSTIDKGRWKHNLGATLIGARDLSKYDFYSRHYIDRNQTFEPLLDSKLTLKNQRSPAYITVDTSLSYELDRSFVISLGVNNIFNYTQVMAGDNPSNWHWHFNHGHYDGLHTWGPNRGRQFFLKLDGKF